MNELTRLIASVRNQLYANALLRCALLGAAAFVVASALTDAWLIQARCQLCGDAWWAFLLPKSISPKSPRL